jgi:hypothetical protein
MAESLVYQPVFVANVVEAPSTEHVATLEDALRDGRADYRPQYKELPTGSRGVRLKVNTIQVMDGLQGALGRPAAGGVYVVTSVTDGLGEQPITLQGKVYPGVQNGDLLPLGPQGDTTAVFNVYLREGRLPRLLSFNLLVLRSNEGLREMGRVISRTVQDERFKRLSELVGDAAGAANPAYGIVWQAADEAMSLLGMYLEAKRDDQLGYYQANFTNLFDDLGVGKHPPDRPSMPVGKTRLSYEINVI